MITRMEVASIQPGAPALPLGRGFMPHADPVQIRDINGLGPVKADISSTPFATGRGELYQGISTGKRNIVLTLGLNPDWINYTMMALRHLLYRYFMPERWATLKFFSDEFPAVYIRGVVESCEPNIFSQDPEMQVSLICPKPDFIDAYKSVVQGEADGSEVTIDYIGSVPVGFSLLIAASDDLPTYTGPVTVTNTAGGISQTFAVNSLHVDQATNKHVEINTAKSTRHIYAITDEQKANVLASVASDSIWLELSPGENIFTVSANEPGLQWHLGYFNRFGGL